MYVPGESAAALAELYWGAPHPFAKEFLETPSGLSWAPINTLES